MTADRPTRESLEYLDGPSWVRTGQSREQFVEPIEAVTGPAASKKADLGADAIAALLAQRRGSRVSQVTLQTQLEIR